MSTKPPSSLQLNRFSKECEPSYRATRDIIPHDMMRVSMMHLMMQIFVLSYFIISFLSSYNNSHILSYVVHKYYHWFSEFVLYDLCKVCQRNVWRSTRFASANLSTYIIDQWGWWYLHDMSWEVSFVNIIIDFQNSYVSSSFEGHHI